MHSRTLAYMLVRCVRSTQRIQNSPHDALLDPPAAHRLSHFFDFDISDQQLSADMVQLTILWPNLCVCDPYMSVTLVLASSNLRAPFYGLSVTSLMSIYSPQLPYSVCPNHRYWQNVQLVLTWSHIVSPSCAIGVPAWNTISSPLLVVITTLFSSFCKEQLATDHQSDPVWFHVHIC